MAVTKEQALTATCFEHVSEKNADGTPVRARRNGQTTTWKTRPTHFKVPVKYGLKNCFYITEQNAKNWDVA